MCDHSNKRLFPEIDLSKVPERFRALQLCRICSYVYRECENMGQLNCRFHPRDPKLMEDEDGTVALRYPCCGIVARTYEDSRIRADIFSDGCTLCDHQALENCIINNQNSELHIQLPPETTTSFHSNADRHTCKRIYDIDLLEVFPTEMTRKFNIPKPHPDLIIRSFASMEQFTTWLEEPNAFVQTYVGGLSGRVIREPRERVSKNSLGANYLRALTSNSKQAKGSELSRDELRMANMQALYHNTWKETVPQSESSALLYRRPQDFFRKSRAEQIDGEIQVYQRGRRERGVLWQRRGKATGIVI